MRSETGEEKPFSVMMVKTWWLCVVVKVERLCGRSVELAVTEEVGIYESSVIARFRLLGR